MDLAPAIGIGLGFTVVVAANVMEGGNPMSLLLLPPMMLVFGTTVLVTMAGGTMKDAKTALGSLKRAFTGDVQPPEDLVPQVVDLAERARREGLLALEEHVRGVDDEFLKRGVTMAIDGTDPEELRDILESEVYAKRANDKQAAKFFADAGAYAPTIGIIGTVMGLVHVLENLAQPEELGHLIAARLRGHPVGRHLGQRHLPAAGQPPQAARRARGRPHGDDHRGRRCDPGRVEPPPGGPEAAFADGRRRGRGGLTWGTAGASAATRRSTRTTSGGWSPTPTW